MGTAEKAVGHDYAPDALGFQEAEHFTRYASIRASVGLLREPPLQSVRFFALSEHYSDR
jgi:hypothetical protein